MTISATILEVVPAYSMAIGCSRNLIDQAEWLAEFFEGDPEWGLSGEELILTSGENRIAFIAESPASAKRLQSVRRSPPGLHGKPASDREVTLAERIMSDDHFRESDECRQLRREYLDVLTKDIGTLKPADIGRQGVEQAVAALKGEETTPEIGTDFEVITKENLSEMQDVLYNPSC